MNESQADFLNAYREYQNLNLRTALVTHGLAYPTYVKTRLDELQNIMVQNETPEFNRGNADSHLRILSSEGQDLPMNLDLNNPEHSEKLEIYSLAFSDDQQDWSDPNVQLPIKLKAMKLKMDILSQERLKEADATSRSTAVSKVVAQGGAAAAAFAYAGPEVFVPAALGAALSAAIDSGFQDKPELRSIIPKEFVELFPEYFLSGLCPDTLLSPEARATITEKWQYKIGLVALNQARKAYPLKQEEVASLQKEANVRSVGKIIAADKEDARDFLEKAWVQNVVAEAAQAAKQAASNKITPSRVSHVGNANERQLLAMLLSGMGRDVREIKAHLVMKERQKMEQARIQRAKTAAQSLVELGGAIDSPFLMKVGQIGQITMGLQESLQKTQQSLAQLVQGGGIGELTGLGTVSSVFAFLSGPIGIATAALKLFSLFSRRRRSGGDGLTQALKTISRQIQALHQEMRSSFTQTWEMLNEMEKHNVLRFDLTMKALDELYVIITTEFDRVNEKLEQVNVGLARLQEHVQHIEDQSLREILEEIRVTEETTLWERHPHYTAPIANWLLRTATLPDNSGRLPVSRAQVPIEELRATLSQGLFSRFGFYFDLFRDSLEQERQSIDAWLLVDVLRWLPVFFKYSDIILIVQEGIAQSSERVIVGYLEQFKRIETVADTNFLWMDIVFKNSETLISGLIQRYEAALSGIVADFSETLSAARKGYRKQYALNEGVGIDLTENFQESFDKISRGLNPDLSIQSHWYFAGQETVFRPAGTPGYGRIARSSIGVLSELALNSPELSRLITDQRWLFYSEVYKLAYLKITAQQLPFLGFKVQIYMNRRGLEDELLLIAFYRFNNSNNPYTLDAPPVILWQGNPHMNIQVHGSISTPQQTEILLQQMMTEVKQHWEKNFASLQSTLNNNWRVNPLFLELDRFYLELIHLIKFLDPAFDREAIAESITLAKMRALYQAFMSNPSYITLNGLNSYLENLKAQAQRGIWVQEFLQSVYGSHIVSAPDPKAALSNIVQSNYSQGRHPLWLGLTEAKQTLQHLENKLPKWKESLESQDQTDDNSNVFKRQVLLQNDLLENARAIEIIESEITCIENYLKRVSILTEQSSLDPKIQENLEGTLQKKRSEYCVLQEQRNVLCARIVLPQEEIQFIEQAPAFSFTAGSSLTFFAESRTIEMTPQSELGCNLTV